MRWAAPVIRAGGQTDTTENSGDSGDSGGDKRSWRAPGPVLQGLIAFAIYLVLFVFVFGRALLPHLSMPEVGQVQVDPNFSIWAMGWWPYAITHGLNPLYSTQISAQGIAATGVNLAWVTTTPTVALLMWPVTALVGPIVSFNLTLLLAPPASAWAAFIVTRRMTGRFWAALLAGAIYSFNVGEMFNELSGWPNLAVTVLVPLAVYVVLLWWDGTLKRTGFIVCMAVILAAQFYTFDEIFADVTMVGACAFVIGFVVAYEHRRKIVQLAVHTAIAYLGALVVAAPYVYYALKHYPASFTRSQPAASLDLSSLVLPMSQRLLGMKWWAAAAGHDLKPTSYVGIPLLVLVLLLAITNWSNRVTRLLAVLFVAIVALAVGPILYVDGQDRGQMPWGGLWHLPLLRSAMPLRLMLFGYLVLSICLALWFAQLTKSKLVRGVRWGLGVLAIAAIFADLPTFGSVVVPPKPTPAKWVPAVPSLPIADQMPEFFTKGIYKKYIKPGERVVVISHRGNAGMLFQAYTGFYFRIEGSFVNASLSHVWAVPDVVEKLSYPVHGRATAFRAFAKKTDLGAVIVERAWSEKWMYIFGRMGYKTTTVGGVTIYQLQSH